MSEGQLVSLVALVGWLILVASGYRAYRVGARKTIVMALVWLAIFAGVAIIFGMLM